MREHQKQHEEKLGEYTVDQGLYWTVEHFHRV